MGARRTFLLLFLLFALAGCTPVRENRPAVLQYEMRSLTRASGVCDSAGTPCVSLRFSYPAITPARSSPGIDSIVAYINGQMFASLEDAEHSLPFDSIAAGLFEQYQDLVEEFSGYNSPWSVERSTSILRDTAGIVSIRFQETSYLGGAHPMDIVRLASFDGETGKRLVYDDVFRRGYESSFARIAEMKFRAARSVADSQSMADAGFWVEEGKFEPSQNFAVGNSDLILYYNPYEVAPYALGPTEVRIPFTLLKEIIRRDGPLGGME